MNKSLFIRVIIAVATSIVVAANVSAKLIMKNYWREEGVIFAPQSSYPFNMFTEIQDYLLIASLAGILIFVVLTMISHPKSEIACITLGIPAIIVVGVFMSLLSAGVPVPLQTIIHPKTGARLMLVDKSDYSKYAWDIVRPEPGSRYRWRRVFGGSGEEMELSHSAEGEYASNPKLYITEAGARVFLQRGGLWTDCVDISENPPVMCSETPLKRLVAEAWERRSHQIEKMVKSATIKF